MGTFYKSFLSSCLGRLFTDKPLDDTDLCPTKSFKQNWLVVTENETTIIIFSKKRRDVDILCADSRRSRRSILGLEFIEIQPGCMISNEQFVTRRSRITNMDEQRIIVTPWSKETKNAWAEVLKEEEERKVKLEQDLDRGRRLGWNASLLEEEPEWEGKDARWSETMPTYVWGLVASTAVLALILVCLLVFLLWRFCKANPNA